MGNGKVTGQLSFVLAIYVLLLTILPCPDADFGISEKFRTSIEQTHAGTHSDHPDGCSPFCTCQCCQASCCITAMPASCPLAEIRFTFVPLSMDLLNPGICDFLIPPKA